MGYDSEFDTIHVNVDFPGMMIPPFVDHYFLQGALTSRAAELVRSYGYKCEEGSPGQLGGGMLGSVLEILKSIWDNREYIGLVAGVLMHVNAHLINRRGQKLDESKSRMVINLRVSNLEELPDSPNNGELRRLVLLKHLADAVRLDLSGMYSAIEFSERVSLTWGKDSARYHLDLFFSKSRMQNWQLWRAIKMINGLKVRPNFTQSVSFKSILTIRRDSTVSNVKIGQTMRHYKEVKYFTLISVQVLRDRFDNVLRYRRSKAIKH